MDVVKIQFENIAFYQVWNEKHLQTCLNFNFIDKFLMELLRRKIGRKFWYYFFKGNNINLEIFV